MVNSAYRYVLFIISVFIVPGGFICFSQDTISSHDNHAIKSEKKILIGEIIIEGNQKTNKNIILRELKVSDGLYLDSLSLILALSESKKNLLKLPLFNYVTIEAIGEGIDIVNIKIIVEERWFTWPQLSIINNERNFNTWLQNKDFSKLDYRVAVKQYNVMGLNHLLSIGLSYGYTRELSLAYQNIFLDKKQHHFLGMSARIFKQSSTFYRTYQNKQESFTNNENDVIWGKYVRLEYDYRPKYNARHGIDLSYNEVEISDSLANLNPVFLANNQTKNKYFEIKYQFFYDNRDSRSYPLSGYSIDFNIFKTGIGIFPNNSVDLLSISGTFKEFYKISERFYGAHSFSVKKSLENNQPYYFKKGLGYRDFLRGFEYYVIDCEDYYLLKNTFKFELLPPTISNLNFIPIRKFKKIHYAFYLSTFFDLGYAQEKDQEIVLQNNLSNRLLFSGGIGFDISTYYDKVIRFEYSINSLGEPGIFIHFKASI